jgi:hypothetical protein
MNRKKALTSSAYYNKLEIRENGLYLKLILYSNKNWLFFLKIIQCDFNLDIFIKGKSS